MFRDLWREMPRAFKVVWFASAALSLTIVGLVVAVLIKLIRHL